MIYQKMQECDLYLNEDLVITKSSPIFNKKRGNAREMFYPRDIKEILALRDGESICAEIAASEKGVAFVKRTDDGYTVRHIGIAGELYTALGKRGNIQVDLDGFKPAMRSQRTRSHFVEMIRLINTISSAVYRPYNLSDAPVYHIVEQELRRMGFNLIFKQKGFVCARVSAREYNLMVAAAAGCAASFARNDRMYISLLRLGDRAVFSISIEFGGSDNDRKVIKDYTFDSEHSDLAMLEMMCANIDWQFICGFEGVDDRIMRIGFALPVAPVPIGKALFLSPYQPLSDELKDMIKIQFEYK